MSTDGGTLGGAGYGYNPAMDPEHLEWLKARVAELEGADDRKTIVAAYAMGAKIAAYDLLGRLSFVVAIALNAFASIADYLDYYTVEFGFQALMFIATVATIAALSKASAELTKLRRILTVPPPK